MNKKIFKNDKIFIAGSTGMVGSSIKRHLIKSGYGDSKFGGALLTPNRSELNLLDYQNVKKWFEINKPEVVIIAAAKVGGIMANYTKSTEFILNNLKIQNNIIENAWKNNTRRLLFLGSSCIYPRSCPQPIKEEYLLSGSLEKTNQWYALAKIAGIKLCQALREEHGFDSICLMPTNLYGPGDNYDPYESHVMAALISKFHDAAKRKLKNVICWGSGNPYREFMYVDDLANAVLFCLENWDPDKENSPKFENGENLNYLNVGTGRDITIRELATKIAQKNDFQGSIIWDESKPDGTPKKQLDISRIRSLGWSAQTDLDVGISKAIKGYSQEFNI